MLSQEKRSLTQTNKIPTVNILGVEITQFSMLQAIQAVKGAVNAKRKTFVVVPNVFVITECRRDAYYKNIINSADMAFADGMPLVWVSRLLGQYTGGRVSGADFFSIFNMVAEKERYSCYYLGGGPGGSERIVENLRRRHPKLQIAGNFSPPLGYIPESLNEKIVNEINYAKPDILWVGLGAPRQEKWIYSNFNKLNIIVSIGVGAAFDYAADKRKRAPRWMQKISMEWAYRILFENPTLFWKKRYYAYLWEFIMPVIGQVVKNKFFKSKNHNDLRYYEN